MEEFSIDLEKLKVEPGDEIRADRITSIVQAIIENKRAIIKHQEKHNSERSPP